MPLCLQQLHTTNTNTNTKTTKTSTTTTMIYKQESKVQFVVDAVYSFAYALHNAWFDLCKPDEGYCTKLKELDGETFYKHYLLNVSFIGLYFFYYYY